MADLTLSATNKSLARKGRWLDRLTVSATLLGAVTIIGMLVLLAGLLTRDAWPAIRHFGLWFLVSTEWNPNPEVDTFGALPVIYGTLVSSAIALVLAVPLSIGSAIFLVRVAPRWLATPVSFLIELLAAIPSIAYGFWGIAVLVPLLRNYLQPLLRATLGPLPVVGKLFSGPAQGYSLMAAGMILAIMITPIITAVSRDILKSVPKELEEGAYGLGATWWQVMGVMLGFGKAGIFGAVVLGLARAIGETMAVAMVIGNATQISASLSGFGQTMSSLLANEFADASTDRHRESMIYVALILLVMTVVVNAGARALVLRGTAKAGGNSR